MPERVIEKIKNSILSQWKICFFSAVIIGLTAHLYKFTNWLPNWDSIVFRYDAQNMIGLGRWFLGEVCSLTSFYDLPWLNGLMAIVFHALGSVCICKMFNIKKGITAFLIGAIVVTFPTVTSVMMYNYVADGYSIAFFLACLSAMNLTKEKPNYVSSVIMLTLSIAIYQAYMSVTVMLLLLYLIDELIFQKKDVSVSLKKSMKFMLSGIISVALYYLILLGLLRLSGESLLEYQGVSSAFSLSNISIWSSLYVSVHTFLDYFFDFSKGLNVFSVLNIIIFAVMVIVYFISAIKSKSFAKVLALGIYVLLLPIGAGILAFVNCNVDYHNLMKMGFCVFYLFFVILYERADFSNKKVFAIKSWLVFIVSCILIFNQIVIANVSYHKLQMACEKSYGTLIRIVDRIEQTEGADICNDVLVIGSLPGSEAYSDNLPPDMTGTTESYILRADDETVNQSVLCSALNDYCGKSYQFVLGAEKRGFLENEKVRRMACWPHKDSITVMDDVIVIKLGAESD